mgnify:CR=1 FL=1
MEVMIKMKTVKVTRNNIKDLWERFKECVVIQRQATDEGISCDRTVWKEKYEEALKKDDEMWQNCRTPISFFTDTIHPAIRQELTFDEYLKVCTAYGIEVVE